MRTTKVFAALAALLALSAAATGARAADRDALIKKARAYVESDKVSKTVLGLMHLGADYTGTDALGVCKVTDEDGQELAGEFAVKVKVHWAFSAGDDDWTEVYYFFNARGRFTGLKAGDTTAIISQPFAVGGLAIDVIKDALVDSIKDKPDAEKLIKLIKKANAKNLTEIMVGLDQP